MDQEKKRISRHGSAWPDQNNEGVTIETEQVVHSKAGTATIKITPMYSSPGVIHEYRLQPKVLENLQGEDLWSNVDFVGFFGNKYPERYKTFSEAEGVAKKLVNRVEEAWK